MMDEFSPLFVFRQYLYVVEGLLWEENARETETSRHQQTRTFSACFYSLRHFNIMTLTLFTWMPFYSNNDPVGSEEIHSRILKWTFIIFFSPENSHSRFQFVAIHRRMSCVLKGHNAILNDENQMQRLSHSWRSFAVVTLSFENWGKNIHTFRGQSRRTMNINFSWEKQVLSCNSQLLFWEIILNIKSSIGITLLVGDYTAGG